MPPNISVLWDLDTCYLAEESASDVVAAVRRLALILRGAQILKVNAYWGTNSLLNTFPGLDLRKFQESTLSELNSLGVTVHGTDFLGDEGNTMQVMIADLFLEFVDAHKSPPMVVIISNRKAFNRPKNILTNRHRVVHLISSEQLQEAVRKVKEEPRQFDPVTLWPIVSSGTAGSNAQSIVPTNETPASPGSQVSPVSPTPLLASPVPIGQNQPAMGGAPPLHPSILANVDPKFVPLVEVLEWARTKEGRPSLVKSLLGNKIIEKAGSSYYKEVGFKNFKKYIEEAERLGIIEVEGDGTDAKVVLKPPSEAPIQPDVEMENANPWLHP